jgi:tRNA A-37 threonylcarbamoyl transferase component Bud32
MNTPTCPICGGPMDAGGACARCAMGFALGAGSPTVFAADGRVGTTFRGMAIEARIGRGGMGVVYRARQEHLGRTVALKLVTEELARNPEFVERFRREARVMSALQHPNIVAVHEFGFEGSVPYLVMELVEGENLRSLMRERRLAPQKALRIVPQVCEALEFAHARGVVHRDIKPENLLVTADGTVKITDFGLARSTEGEQGLTRSDAVMGTPHYMAPEQVENPKSVDHRADIYSLGVVIYEMLTGELPLGKFEAPSRRAEVAQELDGIVLKALEKQPAERWQRAGELQRAVSGVGATARTQEEADDGDHSWFLGFLIPGIVGSLTGTLPDGVPRGVKTALILASSVSALLWVFAPPSARRRALELVGLGRQTPIESGPLKGLPERWVWVLLAAAAVLIGGIPLLFPAWPFRDGWLWGPIAGVGVLLTTRAQARSPGDPARQAGLIALGVATILIGLSLISMNRWALPPTGLAAFTIGARGLYGRARRPQIRVLAMLSGIGVFCVCALAWLMCVGADLELAHRYQKSWSPHLMGVRTSEFQSFFDPPDSVRILSAETSPEASRRGVQPVRWHWGRWRALDLKAQAPWIVLKFGVEADRPAWEWDLTADFDETGRCTRMNPMPAR